MCAGCVEPACGVMLYEITWGVECVWDVVLRGVCGVWVEWGVALCVECA